MDGACMSCHGDKFAEKSLKESVKVAHNLHQTVFTLPPNDKLMGNQKCEFCHTKKANGDLVAIDLTSPPGAGVGAQLRKQVDSAHCAACHCKGSKKLFAACL